MTKIEISHKTIFFIAVFIFFLWILFQIKDILFLLFVSFVIMSGLRPVVDLLEKVKIPRGVAIVVSYIALFSLIAGVTTALLPPLVSETVRFITQISSYVNKYIPFAQLNFQDVISQVGPISQNILRVTVGVFSNIITFFMLLVFSFYLLLERKNLRNFLQDFIGERQGFRISKTVITIEKRLGGWIRGQLALMIIIGISVYIGLSILRVPFALPLAIIAGLLEVVPNIGPIISAVPAMIVAFKPPTNPFLALAIAALYFIIQQVENGVVVPFVMRKVVGLPPLVTIISLLIGGRLAGIPGVLFSVPFVLIVQTVIAEFWIPNKANK